MAFRLTAEQLMVQRMVREFARTRDITKGQPDASRLRQKAEFGAAVARGLKAGFRERTHENPAGLPGKKK